jgi:23S rRNA (cytidine2498-2'-O)-methyltransferase
VLPDAREVSAPSIRTWATLLVEAVAGTLPDDGPWSLHVYPFERSTNIKRVGARAWHSQARAGKPSLVQEAPVQSLVGHERCRLIREAVLLQLQKKRRHLLRSLRTETQPFAPDEALVQLVLSQPEHGFLSVAPAPMLFKQRHVISPFAGGEVELARDKAAPSRAFAKLIEAEARLGRSIQAGETCVDLGASPGSWTYVAALRGARVIAVDRAELRADLMQHRSVRFQRADAFRYEPPAAVDWLLCDVIASADRSAELLLTWLRKRWCRRFIVTLKVSGASGDEVVTRLKRELPALTSELWLLHLCANKNEVTAFGKIAE